MEVLEGKEVLRVDEEEVVGIIEVQRSHRQCRQEGEEKGRGREVESAEREDRCRRIERRVVKGSSGIIILVRRGSQAKEEEVVVEGDAVPLRRSEWQRSQSMLKLLQ